MNSDHAFSLLATQTLEVSMVIALVWVLTATVLRRRQHLAYALWLVVLVKAVTPPVWSCPTGVFSWVFREPPRAAAVQVSAITADFSALSTAHQATPPLAITPSMAHSRVTPSASQTAATSPPVHVLRLATAILLAWLTGSALILANILIITARLRRRALLSAVGADHPAVGRLTRITLNGMPRIVVTTESIGPALIGVLRPLIVIPLQLVEKVSDGELRAIIAHETTHLRRGDHRVAALQRLVISIWWFNPLVWFAHYQTNRTRELCCDGQTVASLDCDPADYAQMLLDVLRQRDLPCRAEKLLPGVHAMQITTKRVSVLMNNRSGFRRRTPVWAWLLFLAASLAVLPGAGWIGAADGPASTAVTGSSLVLHGQLIDSTKGLPVANASISVEFSTLHGLPGTANAFQYVQNVDVRSNRDGKYEVPVPAKVADSDRYWSAELTIRDRDHGTQTVNPCIGGVIRKTAESPTCQSHLSIKLATCRIVTSRVLGPDHKPLGNVQIDATSLADSDVSDAGATDQAGRFSVHVLRDGRAILYGSPALAAAFEIQADRADVGDIQTQPGRRVTGQVLDADRHPVAGAHVFAYAKHSLGAQPPDGQEIRSAVTAADGRYELAPLAAGSYVCLACRPSLRRKRIDRQAGCDVGLGNGSGHHGPFDAGCKRALRRRIDFSCNSIRVSSNREALGDRLKSAIQHF